MSEHLFLLMQAAVATPTSYHYLVGSEKIFLLFFIMLGPIKMLGPFFSATRELEPAALHKLALKVFSLAIVAVLVGGLLGSSILRKWQIDPDVMTIAGGIVFLLVALHMVMAMYEHPEPPSGGGPQAMRLVFPVTVTPYGIAALIVLMALSADTTRSLSVMGAALGVMVLNLLAMWFVRPIMHWIGPVPLQILGAVLGILQVALALQFIVAGLKGMGVPLAA